MVHPLTRSSRAILVRDGWVRKSRRRWRNEREPDSGAQEGGAWEESCRVVAVPAQHVLSDAAPCSTARESPSFTQRPRHAHIIR